MPLPQHQELANSTLMLLKQQLLQMACHTSQWAVALHACGTALKYARVWQKMSNSKLLTQSSCILSAELSDTWL